MSLFLAWRHLVRWLRTLILKISRKQPISVTDEINELTKIANEAMDATEYPMPNSDPKPNQNPTDAPSPTPPPPENEKAKLFHGRLMEWLRRRNVERKEK